MSYSTYPSYIPELIKYRDINIPSFIIFNLIDDKSVIKRMKSCMKLNLIVKEITNNSVLSDYSRRFQGNKEASGSQIKIY
jgi:hypothetical protein